MCSLLECDAWDSSWVQQQFKSNKIFKSYKTLQKPISRLSYTNRIFGWRGSTAAMHPTSHSCYLVFTPEEPHKHFWSHWILLFKSGNLKLISSSGLGSPQKAGWALQHSPLHAPWETVGIQVNHSIISHHLHKPVILGSFKRAQWKSMCSKAGGYGE